MDWIWVALGLGVLIYFIDSNKIATITTKAITPSEASGGSPGAPIVLHTGDVIPTIGKIVQPLSTNAAGAPTSNLVYYPPATPGAASGFSTQVISYGNDPNKPPTGVATKTPNNNIGINPGVLVSNDGNWLFSNGNWTATTPLVQQMILRALSV